MAGIFNFKNGNPATDIVVEDDAGGTVETIVLKLDSNQDETEASNIQDFERLVLRKFNCTLSKLGAVFNVDLPSDLMEVKLHRNTALFDMEKAICFGQAIQYISSQVLDRTIVSREIANSVNSYATRLTPSTIAANFVTTTGTDPILNFDVTADIAGTNTLEVHKKHFQDYARKVLGLTITSSPSFIYSIVSGATDQFLVEIKVGTSDKLNQDSLRLSVGTEDNISSWFHAVLLGMQALV